LRKSYRCYPHWAIAIKYWRNFYRRFGRIIMTQPMQLME